MRAISNMRPPSRRFSPYSGLRSAAPSNSSGLFRLSGIPRLLRSRRLPAPHHRCAGGRQRATPDAQRGFRPPLRATLKREFVSAITRPAVSIARLLIPESTLAQAAANRARPDQVTVAVIDLFEAIKIHKKHGEPGAQCAGIVGFRLQACSPKCGSCPGR